MSFKSLLFMFSSLIVCHTAQAMPNFLNSQPPQDACYKTCLLNADCGATGAVCTGGFCSYQPRFCTNERWSTNERGELQDCRGYRCDEKSGLCRTEAKDSGDCSAGYVHDGKGACVQSVNCDTQELSCQELLEKWKQTRKKWEDLYPKPQLPVFSCLPCQQHDQCSNGKMCWNHRCAPEGRYCEKIESGEEVSRNKDVILQSCGEYSCHVISGECRNFCLQDDHCAPGFLCSKDRRCVSFQK